MYKNPKVMQPATFRRASGISSNISIIMSPDNNVQNFIAYLFVSCTDCLQPNE